MDAALEEIGQTALDYSPGTDADGFAVRQETADELGLETMSDLAERRRPADLGPRLGMPGQPDCGPGLNDVYGIDIAHAGYRDADPVLRRRSPRR